MITETEAVSRFWELLDAVESGERFTVTRRGVPVAEIGPVRRRTDDDPRTRPESVKPPDGGEVRRPGPQRMSGPAQP
ncbi:type II toxin-antitoxin system prevent-host-death family antitoxin [Nocardiopsis dassonvillei]|uniref:type II toxin-antitoxin system Phd/YefM family antitoxin n=1 Tax=Nocardiopsis dassonvillei TaxID=2014 RepID=UPI00200FE5B9|nr:type II toxin-antitoxin system prevent-host-death family antitoxin [Nocardiopsis dassonvillei]MCK9872085.1 type II toxin-antitoxin system prevent-host-death family antitoxin [Nocardiopsis dassonvillei]